MESTDFQYAYYSSPKYQFPER